ncbi:cytochrome C [uncultured Paracoccus sp.]|uniref:cytochrome C n=1 Tax=uncultured Paracoccus sp. TaxID=189685 RepID=UPI00263589E4|nr:cytochrome C [uncultured Paracoccus sp.]
MPAHPLAPAWIIVLALAAMPGLPRPGLAQTGLEPGGATAAPPGAGASAGSGAAPVPAPALPGEVPWVIPPSGPFNPETIPVPNAAAIAAWARSAHADAGSEAFSHWNDEGEIPPVCANCHSGMGFRAFHGLDGGSPGPLEAPVQTGGVVDCATCHSPGLADVTEVVLPNGMSHPVPPGEVTCLTCHQGRSSGDSVTAATENMPPDTPNPALSFINPHYAIAAATWLGGHAGLGYQYPGKTYAGRFLHAPPVTTCNSCHDPHSLRVNETACRTCHTTGQSRDIRISRQSHDGSGVTTKGIRADIDANAARLKSMILDYAAKVAGVPVIYDGERHPYFFTDANDDGVVDQSGGRPVAYNAWTPRLLRAAYNWKFVNADPGAHVHNPPYALQLLHDSMEDLAGPLDLDFAALGLVR